MSNDAYRRFWGPQQEADFQTFMAFDPNVRTWRNAFQRAVGGPPQTEGGDYDYRAAWLAGQGPQPVSGDTVPHWGSAGKRPGHPTEWKQQFMTQFGIDPDTAGNATPAQSSFLNQQLVNDFLSNLDPWGTLAPRRR